MSYDLTIKKKKLNHDAIEEIALRDEKALRKVPEITPSIYWNEARHGVHKYINVRISEEYFMKLDYVSKKHRISKNKICLDVVIAEIDRMLGE